jgi:hypothetical protein
VTGGDRDPLLGYRQPTPQCGQPQRLSQLRNSHFLTDSNHDVAHRRHRFILLAFAGLTVMGCSPTRLVKGEIEDAPQPTASQRAEIEARIRACGLPVRNGRWLLVESLGQWQFGFETDASLLSQPNAVTECVAAASDEARRAWFRPPIIAFTGG